MKYYYMAFFFSFLFLIIYFSSNLNLNNCEYKQINNEIRSSILNEKQNINESKLDDLNLFSPLKELFVASEQQKLIDKQVLIKTLAFMIQETDEYDPKLIEFVKSLIKVKSPNSKLNLTNKAKTDFSQIGQSKLIDEWLKSKRDGFYIEAGGFDGESHSVNTKLIKFLN